MLLTLLLLAYIFGGASAPPSPFTLIQSSNWEDRYDGAKLLIANYPLSDPKIQQTLINLLKREDADPNWEELEELEPYEDYYDSLLTGAVQKIAATYHNKSAFYTLTHGNYNADSQFGHWLATQPEAFPILLTQAKDDPNLGLRRLANEVLAYAVSFCPPGNQEKTCKHINQRRNELMAHFRTLAHNLKNDNEWYTGVVCLSICGTSKDLAWMKNLQSERLNVDLARTLNLYIPDLEKHLGVPVTPNPPLPAPPSLSH